MSAIKPAAQVPRTEVIDANREVVVDNVLLDYAVEDYPFGAWVLGKVEERGYEAGSLDALHETVHYDRVSALTRWMIGQTASREWRAIAHSFTRDVLEPFFGTEIAVQRYMNIRVMPPRRHEMTVPFHNGLWYGHSLGEATCWVPLTRAWGTNSLQVIGRRRSAELVARAEREGWGQDEMQRVFVDNSASVDLGPGQALLFNQEVIHGNTPNETTKTRVSIDFRLAVRGGKIRRKMVGGYFTLLDESVRRPG